MNVRNAILRNRAGLIAGFIRTPIPALRSMLLRAVAQESKKPSTLSKRHGRCVAQKAMMPGLVCGFTLVETLVAIAILTIAIIGPFHAIQTALNVSRASRDALIAASLAQESLEYVRGARDNNFAYASANPSNPGSWLYGFDGTSRGGTASYNCMSSYCSTELSPSYTLPTQVLAVCGATAASCPMLYLSTTGRYTRTVTTTTTHFKRSLILTTVNAHEVKVTSIVSWVTGGVPYTTTLVDYLQNWL